MLLKRPPTILPPKPPSFHTGMSALPGTVLGTEDMAITRFKSSWSGHGFIRYKQVGLRLLAPFEELCCVTMGNLHLLSEI